MSSIDEQALHLRARLAATRVAAITAAAPLVPSVVPPVVNPVDEINVDGERILVEDAVKQVKEYKPGTGLNPKNQPRDDRGKFRKVLARLKQNLGASGLQDVTEKIQQIENLDFAGNYVAANHAAGKLVDLVDRIDTGAIDSKNLEGVRATATELGKVIANTPLPFGNENAKLSFSDLPPSMKTLAQSMIKRVMEKLGPEDGPAAVAEIKAFMSGSDQLSQGEVQGEFSKLLRLLT